MCSCTGNAPLPHKESYPYALQERFGGQVVSEPDCSVGNLGFASSTVNAEGVTEFSGKI